LDVLGTDCRSRRPCPGNLEVHAAPVATLGGKASRVCRFAAQPGNAEVPQLSIICIDRAARHTMSPLRLRQGAVAARGHARIFSLQAHAEHQPGQQRGI